MSDAPNDPEIWSILLPVVVGGVLAVFGGAIGPVMSHLLSSRASRQSIRTQRFDEMMASVYEHDHWLDLKRRSMVFGESLEAGPPPIYRARSIALTNFKDLVQPIKKLDAASSGYQFWMASAGQNRLKGELSALTNGFDEAYKTWLAEFLEFQNAASDYAIARKGRV
jgi:hypothetical protein